MAEKVNGAGGIPLKGREVEYATQLWLEGPSAFWLHPEGPLSDTTPDEWLAAQPPEKPAPPQKNMHHLQLLRQANSLNPYSGMMNAQTYRDSLNGFGGISSGLAKSLFG